MSAPLPPILDDLHAMLLDDGFEFWGGLYHKSGTTWRLERRRGGWRLVATSPKVGLKALRGDRS
ncbi:MAG TPA: hypothetical protein VNU68_35250 [Verrucomicrobiae bacterium]|nr:hypothetical protein [Verrucomicrobiae bacterium]